jgi:hypothetical protein
VYCQHWGEPAVKEADLIIRVKAVAAQRRNLPPGGRLKEN